MVTTISWVSLPVIISGSSNCPVTTHEPAGMGEVVLMGFGTVVTGAEPCNTVAGGGGSKAQYPCSLFWFSVMAVLFTVWVVM